MTLQTDHREVFHRHPAALGTRQAAHQGAELNVLERGSPREQGIFLKHHASICPRAGDLRSVHQHPPARWLHEAGDHPEQRRFAAAGWAEQAGETVLRQFQIDPCECGQAIVEGFGNTLDADLGPRDGCHLIHGFQFQAVLRQRSSRASSIRSIRLKVKPIKPITAAPSSICDTRKNVRASLMR